MPAVDVVIPTRDTRELTLACLDSLLGADAAQTRVRCVVVDNASRDGTAAAVAARHPSVTVLRNERDPGYGAACNAGAALGDAPYLLILNSDVTARPGALDRLVGFLAASPGHVAAGGRLLDAGSERTQVGFTVRALPTLRAQVALLCGLERMWARNPVSRRQLMLDFDYERTQDAEQPAGACLLCRRDAFERLGGFDERFHYWFEDVDLVRRLRALGRVGYVHDARFEHVGGASFARWPRPQAIATRHRSLLRYFDKHHPRRERIALRAVVAALALLRAACWLPLDRARARAYASVVRTALSRSLG
ncbi:MAG: glycosyltransferase family 2 protein [Actinobacteria bacterium]|nr:glycosyltransferase family 2 protein [Actinomycetota bacterium]